MPDDGILPKVYNKTFYAAKKILLFDKARNWTEQ